jgi:hypothetical protein
VPFRWNEDRGLCFDCQNLFLSLYFNNLEEK